MIKCTFIKKEIKHYGRCTICTLSCKIPTHVLSCVIMDWVDCHPTVRAQYGGRCLNFTVQGKAVCAEGDKYDEIKGSRIAECRAKKRAYQFCYTLCDKVAKEWYDLYQETTDAASNFFHYKYKEEGHESDLLK